jgi:Leucine-rich repeat (LRR) protein
MNIELQGQCHAKKLHNNRHLLEKNAQLCYSCFRLQQWEFYMKFLLFSLLTIVLVGCGGAGDDTGSSDDNLGSACNAENLNLCTTEDLCTNTSLFWYNNSCHVDYSNRVAINWSIITDSTLEGCIRTNPAQIWTDEVRIINCQGLGISNITGLNQFTDLQNINISNNPNVTDISPLEDIESILEARFNGLYQMSDISALTGMKNLRILQVGDTAITDFSALTGMDSLEILDAYTISKNISGNLSAAGLSNLSALKSLNINNNNIGNSLITEVSGLTNLQTLDVQSNSITDISGLSNLTNLWTLNISSNLVSDISVVSNLTGLGNFVANRTRITSLAAFSGITTLRTVQVASNGITDVSPLASSTNLATLDVSYNDNRHGSWDRILGDSVAIGDSFSSLHGMTLLDNVNINYTQYTGAQCIAFHDSLPNLTNVPTTKRCTSL